MQRHIHGNAELVARRCCSCRLPEAHAGCSTRRIYRYLIPPYIINGEIILWSPVSGVILCEWQAHQQAEIAVPATAPLVDAAAAS